MGPSGSRAELTVPARAAGKGASSAESPLGGGHSPASRAVCSWGPDQPQLQLWLLAPRAGCEMPISVYSPQGSARPSQGATHTVAPDTGPQSIRDYQGTLSILKRGPGAPPSAGEQAPRASRLGTLLTHITGPMSGSWPTGALPYPPGLLPKHQIPSPPLTLAAPLGNPRGDQTSSSDFRFLKRWSPGES